MITFLFNRYQIIIVKYKFKNNRRSFLPFWFEIYPVQNCHIALVSVFSKTFIDTNSSALTLFLEWKMLQIPGNRLKSFDRAQMYLGQDTEEIICKDGQDRPIKFD